eukprot:2743434-Rhodomonas_salina.4
MVLTEAMPVSGDIRREKLHVDHRQRFSTVACLLSSRALASLGTDGACVSARRTSSAGRAFAAGRVKLARAVEGSGDAKEGEEGQALAASAVCVQPPGPKPDHLVITTWRAAQG